MATLSVDRQRVEEPTDQAVPNGTHETRRARPELRRSWSAACMGLPRVNTHWTHLVSQFEVWRLERRTPANRPTPSPIGTPHISASGTSGSGQRMRANTGLGPRHTKMNVAPMYAAAAPRIIPARPPT